MNSLGARVRWLRKQQGLSRADLAARAKVGYSTLASVENDDVRSTARITELAKALGVAVDWLATGTGSMDPHAPVAGPTLSAEEAAILDLYHGMSPSYRAAWEAAGRALAQPGVNQNKAKHGRRGTK